MRASPARFYGITEQTSSKPTSSETSLETDLLARFELG
jgi:hypothetical protein